MAAVDVAIIVLAAGQARRMARLKQLMPYRGKSLVRHAAETAIEAARLCANVIQGPVVVVVGAGAPEVTAELQGLPVTIVENQKWSDGMGGSIARGTKAVIGRDVGAAVLMLCDQPLVTPQVIRDVVRPYRMESWGVVACDYGGGNVGPPVLFAAKYWPDLEQLSGAEGAKKVITKYAHDAEYVPCPAAAVDVDTPGDYESLSR